MEFILSTAAFIVSFLAAVKGLYILSGMTLIGTGILLYFINFRKSGSIIDPAALFSVSWISAAGISCLKLSNLQTDWGYKTWAVIWITYICFISAVKLFAKKEIKAEFLSFRPREKHVYISVIALTAVSYICFTAEALMLGYVPLFTVDTPHAYSYFHISGIHYFTVLCVLVPSLSVIYLNDRKERKQSRNSIIIFTCDFLSLLLPVLLVSRYQLVFAFLLAFITFTVLKADSLKLYLHRKYIIPFTISVAALILLYVLITVERAHSIEYLNGIFEMKDPAAPIFITQPYIYIANNFDNLNCLTSQLQTHTYGLRSLFPLFALTGLKFIKPELVSFPLYVTKEELTTVTLIYDAYYDFGMIGAAAFSFLFGTLITLLSNTAKNSRNPFLILLVSQLTGYLCLSFFTTWFSNPTTWFYIIICIAMNFCMWYNKNSIDFRKEG